MVSRTLKVIMSLTSVLALTVLPPSGLEAAPLPNCPPLLKVSQTGQSVPEHWNQVPFAGTQRLARITFRVSTDPGELRPDDERNIDGQRVLVWNVEGMKGLEQVCEYTGTLVRLVRPVSGVVKRCQVGIDTATPGSLSVSSRCD
jgi:hypothetical protein